MAGRVQYAESDGAFVAYEVDGEGPRDLIVIMDGFVPIDTMDAEPRLARCMSRLNALARLIRFDRRGVGLSDPVAPSAPPTLEQWVEDAIAVLDAVGSSRAVVVAACEMTPVALLLAATHPQRVESLVVINVYARAVVDHDYPDGIPAEEAARIIAACTEISPPEDEENFVFTAVPSAAADPHFRTWWEETGRAAPAPRWPGP